MLRSIEIQTIGNRLREFGYVTLKEYYLSDKWKAVRNRMWNSKTLRECAGCSKKEKLQLHHKSYKNLCKEPLRHLCWLCDDCHEYVHTLAAEKGWSLWKATRFVTRKKMYTMSGQLPKVNKKHRQWWTDNTTKWNKKPGRQTGRRKKKHRIVDLNANARFPVRSYKVLA